MEDFEEYCPGGNELDLDDKDSFIYTPRETPVFEIDRMFNLEPALKANPQYNDLSVLSFVDWEDVSQVFCSAVYERYYSGQVS